MDHGVSWWNTQLAGYVQQANDKWVPYSSKVKLVRELVQRDYTVPPSSLSYQVTAQAVWFFPNSGPNISQAL